ncbi:MAG: hypothetical protein K6F84_07720 [Lachnospiraceae bacterium]|nr:hypothetical protein [Lachnospiraceae bacterium]
MVDEKRVIFMTRLASYEEGEGKEAKEIYKYFRTDYMLVCVAKAFVSVTISFCLLVGLYILYNLESMMGELYEMDFISLAKNLAIWYVGAVIVYGVICYGVGVFKYHKAEKSLKKYYKNLRKLNSLYND